MAAGETGLPARPPRTWWPTRWVSSASTCPLWAASSTSTRHDGLPPSLEKTTQSDQRHPGPRRVRGGVPATPCLRGPGVSAPWNGQATASAQQGGQATGPAASFEVHTAIHRRPRSRPTRRCVTPGPAPSLRCSPASVTRRAVVPVLNGYVASLLLTAKPHRREDLAAWLDEGAELVIVLVADRESFAAKRRADTGGRDHLLPGAGDRRTGPRRAPVKAVPPGSSGSSMPPAPCSTRSS